MKSTELRIGNLVIDRKEQICKVSIIWGDPHSDQQLHAEPIDGGATTYLPHSPIPLTEEWLVKFLWRKIDKYTFSKDGWFIYNRKRGFVTGSKNREVKLVSVHDLQNWYYYNNNKKELHLNG